jgi:hypothetical protein
MKLRTLVLTIVVLAVLSAAAWFIQRPAPPPAKDPRVDQPLVDRATIEKAQKLRLSDQGKTVTLTRQSDASWHVDSYYDFPADFQKLSRFVSDLTDAKPQRLVTSNPDRIARLEFKDTKIELLDGSDKPTWSLTLGKYAETGGGRFVRFDDEKKAYLVNLSVWLDPEPKNWADAQLLKLTADDIAKIVVPFDDGGPVTLSRATKSDPWKADKTPANQKLRDDKITSLLGSLDTLRFTDTLDLKDPKVAEAKPHTRTFELGTFDGKTYTVAFSRKPEEKKLKAPADGKSGPAALGSVEDLAKSKNDQAQKPAEGNSKPETQNAKPSAEPKPLAPEFETIPAGPVFVQVTSSAADAPVNGLMKKRAFEISEYTFTGLPQKSSDLFEPAPAPAKPAEKNAAEKKPEPPKKS